jgi:hypothetical protein
MRAFEGTRSATTSVRCPNSSSRRSVETQDARRPVATEALAGGAKADQIGGKLANSIATVGSVREHICPKAGPLCGLSTRQGLAGRRAIRGTKV